MKDEQKVWIRGVNNRGDEVRRMLTDLGANKRIHYNCENPENLYFIDHIGDIEYSPCYCETAKIIMDNYREIKLPEKQWKDGDILVNKGRCPYFVVYKGRSNHRESELYLYVDVRQKKIGEGYVFVKAGYRLAKPSEIKYFYDLLHQQGKDWDAKKKQLVDWWWKPAKGERFFSITETGKIVSDEWYECSWQTAMFKAHNCFRTEEEAEAMAEKIKKLLKGETN